MSENKLMDKLVAEFNEMCKERISKLDSEIKRLESEENRVVKEENELVDEINNYSPFVPYPGDLDSQIQRDYNRWTEAKSKLFAKRKKLLDRHSELVIEHKKLVAERDSLSKKLGSFSSLSAEAKGEAYYRWLLEEKQSAKSGQEYITVAKKFSDISEYKDCAALAEECNKLAEKAKIQVEIKVAIAKLDNELNTKLKLLDDVIAALKKKLPDFATILTISSIVGAVIGCILFFAVTNYPDKGNFAVLFIGIPVAGVLCFLWESKTDNGFAGCLAWLIVIVFVLFLITLLFSGDGEAWSMLGVWLLYLLVGAAVSSLSYYLYESNKKQIVQQKIANLENQKSALHSERDRIKSALESGGDIEKLFREFQEKAGEIVVNGVTCIDKVISNKKRKNGLLGGVVVGAIVLLSVVCYFSLRPYDPVKDAKKTVAADCDYAAIYNDARMNVYEEFVNSFDSYGFTKRQEARNKLQELLKSVNTEYSIHQSAVRSGSGFFSYCGDGASEDLVKFANAYDTQADMYYPSNQRELSLLYTEVENKITSIKDPDNNEQGVVINSVTWATRNVDKPGTFAAKPEDTGKFFQWNRRKARAATDRESEWVGSNQTGDTWATANDPSPVGWRVPTLDELKSLVNRVYVASEWTTQNGVEGRKFTDKGTGASIFLPATNGSHGSYWSSESTSCPCDDNDCAFSLSFNSDYVEAFRYAAEQYCGIGQSIRPVANK